MGWRNSDRSASLQRARRATPPACLGHGQHLGGEPGLPRARRPAQEHQRALAGDGVVPDPSQRGQLGVPAHEGRPAGPAPSRRRGGPAGSGWPATSASYSAAVSRAGGGAISSRRAFQPLVGQEGRAPVAPAVVGSHEGPVGLLVEGVALDRRGGGFGGATGDHPAPAPRSRDSGGPAAGSASPAGGGLPPIGRRARPPAARRRRGVRAPPGRPSRPTPTAPAARWASASATPPRRPASRCCTSSARTSR